MGRSLYWKSMISNLALAGVLAAGLWRSDLVPGAWRFAAAVLWTVLWCGAITWVNVRSYRSRLVRELSHLRELMRADGRGCRILINEETRRAEAEGVPEDGMPFLFEARGEKGVVLVHGFGSHPGEVRALGKYLHKRGLTVFGPLLAGHGLSGSAMSGGGRPEWLDGVERPLRTMQAEGKKVFVVGVSLGAVCALHLNVTQETGGVVAVSPILRGLPSALLRALRIPVGWKISSGELRGSDNIPVGTVNDLVDLVGEVRTLVRYSKKPVMLICSEGGRYCRPSDLRHLAEMVPGGRAEVRVYDSGPYGPIGEGFVARDEVFEEIYRFLDVH